MALNQVLQWWDIHQRDLPWRSPHPDPWAVLVSEVMLQQTPVARVVPVFTYWLDRWPTPADLAGDTLTEVLKAWDRMGYPRRAQRLHQAALVITTEHGGVVPRELDALLALPGVGDYTARAIRTFAFGIPEAVVDTNIRRVVARAFGAVGSPGPPRTRSDRDAVQAVLEAVDSAQDRCRGVAGLMELGAVVCTARRPRCDVCPIAQACGWRLAGYPAYEGPRPAQQARFEGSDRQVRGIFLRELRTSDTSVPGAFLTSLWPDPEQAQRAVASLLADGLVEPDPEEVGSFRITQPQRYPGA